MGGGGTARARGRFPLPRIEEPVMPDAENPEANKLAQGETETKKEEREALKEQQKREMPTSDWPGKDEH
jgi:hypothetical protein